MLRAPTLQACCFPRGPSTSLRCDRGIGCQRKPLLPERSLRSRGTWWGRAGRWLEMIVDLATPPPDPSEAFGKPSVGGCGCLRMRTLHPHPSPFPPGEGVNPLQPAPVLPTCLDHPELAGPTRLGQTPLPRLDCER